MTSAAEPVTARCISAQWWADHDERSGAHRPRQAGRRRRLRGARAHISGHRLPHRLARRRKRRRRRGGCAGRLRQGVPRALALPHRRAVQAVAAARSSRTRRATAAAPPAAASARAARVRGGRLGGRGPVPRDGAPRSRASRRAARRRQPARRAPPPRDRVPLLPRAVRGGDRRRARLPPRHRQVAPRPRARAAARRARERTRDEPSASCSALAAYVELPPERDLAPAVRARIGARAPAARQARARPRARRPRDCDRVRRAAGPQRDPALARARERAHRVRRRAAERDAATDRSTSACKRPSPTRGSSSTYHVFTSKLLGKPQEVHLLGDQVGFVYGNHKLVVTAEPRHVLHEGGRAGHARRAASASTGRRRTGSRARRISSATSPGTGGRIRSSCTSPATR